MTSQTRPGAWTLLAGRVLTMTDHGVLADQALTIRDGRIAAMGPRESAVLESIIVDWRDRTVLPALADMHSHVAERADMLLNLAHGVTLLRNMWGMPWHLLWQREVAAGRELGPHLVTTSPIVDGRGVAGTTFWPGSACVENADEARDAVSRWAAAGYQQVKAYNWLSHESLQGLGDACADAGIQLVGHCPQDMTVQEAAAHGQTCFEHLTNYELGALPPAARDRLEGLLAASVHRWHPDVAEARTALDDALLADLAAQIAERDVTSVATLIVLDRMFGANDFNDSRLQDVAPWLVSYWRPENNFVLRMYSPEDRRRIGTAHHVRTRRVLAALRDAGARVLVGTDAPNPFVFQGSSVVEEMELFANAGYAPAEIIEMATRGAADFLGLHDRGRVEVGAVADLMSVSGDPLLMVSALRDPLGVVVRGSVLHREQLDGLRAEARQLLTAPPDALSPLPEGEELYGDFARTNFDSPAGQVRVSCCGPTAGLQRWNERIVDRDLVESRSTVIDVRGLLVEASVERARFGGHEAATVTRAADGYHVQLVGLDGATIEATIAGPLVPAPDLGAAASLAAVRAAADDAVTALSLTNAFENSLPPEPVPVLRGEDGSFVFQGRDAATVLRGDDSEYEVTNPMATLRYVRA